MTYLEHDWFSEAQQDIDIWRQLMPVDAQGRPINWDWVQSLNLKRGIGRATESDLAPGTPADLHALLKWDYAVRNAVESILAQCSATFMMDFDRKLSSYRLPRALAYANRRLNDEICLLIDKGAAEQLWTVSSEKRGRATVTVLTPTETCPFSLDDIQDDTDTMLEARTEYRNTVQRSKQRGYQSRYSSSRTYTGPSAKANDSSHHNTNSATTGNATASYGSTGNAQSQPDWRNAYLPGRDVDMVMGIDIETTGTDPARDYILDVGFEYMNMVSPKPLNVMTGYRYEQTYYEEGDAYGQARLSLGVPEHNAQHGNPLILSITGIDVCTRGPQSGLTIFDEYPVAQQTLLYRLQQLPYVAHNATFEHNHFMLNVAGYAESYRNGEITIIDTLPMSKQWDPESAPDEEHPYGNNTLDAYAKRQGALADDKKERHLGLEDAHIMLVAMKHHLNTLRAAGQGPWGPGGIAGVGGKHCKRRF